METTKGSKQLHPDKTVSEKNKMKRTINLEKHFLKQLPFKYLRNIFLSILLITLIVQNHDSKSASTKSIEHGNVPSVGILQRSYKFV